MCLSPRVWPLVLFAVGTVLCGSVIPPGRSFAEDKNASARWEKVIATFERSDGENPPPKNAVLFVGSSSIRFWDLPKSFPEMKLVNRGFGGSQLADSVHFADRIILKHKPRIVVLYAGDNDLAAGKSPEQVFSDFKAFVKTVHAELPKTKIAFISIKPCLLRWRLVDKVRKANKLIEAECRKDKRWVYVDVFHPMLGKNGFPRQELFIFDCLHLNAKGYKLWASILKPHLK